MKHKFRKGLVDAILTSLLIANSNPTIAKENTDFEQEKLAKTDTTKTFSRNFLEEFVLEEAHYLSPRYKERHFVFAIKEVEPYPYESAEIKPDRKEALTRFLPHVSSFIAGFATGAAEASRFDCCGSFEYWKNRNFSEDFNGWERNYHTLRIIGDLGDIIGSGKLIWDLARGKKTWKQTIKKAGGFLLLRKIGFEMGYRAVFYSNPFDYSAYSDEYHYGGYWANGLLDNTKLQKRIDNSFLSTKEAICISEALMVIGGLYLLKD